VQHCDEKRDVNRVSRLRQAVNIREITDCSLACLWISGEGKKGTREEGYREGAARGERRSLDP